MRTVAGDARALAVSFPSLQTTDLGGSSLTGFVVQADVSRSFDSSCGEHRAVQRITFSYEPSTGALSVFCDDRNARQELAKALRDANNAGKKAGAAPAPVAAKPVASAPAPSAPASREDRKADAQARQGKSEELKPLRKELNRIDHRLGVLFGDRTAIEASFASGGLTPAQLADHGKKLKALSEEIGLLEGQWLELSTQVDELSAKVGA